MKELCRSSTSVGSSCAGIGCNKDSRLSQKLEASEFAPSLSNFESRILNLELVRMATETEIKIKINDPADFCRRLGALAARPLSERHFEDNYVLDFPDGRLRANQCLIRVRQVEDQACITFKGRPRAESIFKVREELETGLENAGVAIQILEKLGLSVCFRYQKYRREFALEEVHVAVDETPIGDYVEFEGSEEAIRKLAAKMRIAESQFLRASYGALYMDHCREKGEAPGFMIF
jgi:adenylate cyclase, class 2